MRMKKLVTFFLLGFFLWGCNEEGEPSIALNNEVNEFIWKSMNFWYYWQSDVPQLSDDIYTSEAALNEFLNNYSSPEALYEALLLRGDDFSIIYPDYEVLEELSQGTGTTFGFRAALINPRGTEQVFGFVKFVSDGGPADNAGIVRGDIFTAVDGTELNLDNFSSLLFGRESYTLTLGEYVDNVAVSTDRTAAITAVKLTENPIVLSKVLEDNGSKVGYLLYNQFIFDDRYHQELNNVFGTFRAEGVSELVLDLRYNGGGRITTAQVLASMVYSGASSTDVFASVVYNEKLNATFAGQDLNYYFFDRLPNTEDPINQLDISRVFILTSKSTASASELIIAGLSAYMDVTIVGDTTVGKNVGSVLLYDSPAETYLDKGPDLNPNHRYAIRPIISQFANSNGFTDYINGFLPDITINENTLVGTIRPLGDPDEALLEAALNAIAGVARFSPVAQNSPFITVHDSEPKDKFFESVILDSKNLSSISDNP